MIYGRLVNKDICVWWMHKFGMTKYMTIPKEMSWCFIDQNCVFVNRYSALLLTFYGNPLIFGVICNTSILKSGLCGWWCIGPTPPIKIIFKPPSCVTMQALDE